MGNISEHFDRSEFACKCDTGCGMDAVDHELLTVLETVREHFHKPVRITSGNRCKKHNIAINGATHSQHLLGKAADIQVDDTGPTKIFSWLATQYPDRYGLKLYRRGASGWVHVDVRHTKWRSEG